MPDSRPASSADSLILLESPQLERPRWTSSAAGSLAVHLVFLVVWLSIPEAGPYEPGQRGGSTTLRLTPLVMPPELIKPRAPSPASAAADLTLDKLMATPTPKPQPAPPTTAPGAATGEVPAPGPAPAAQPKPIEAPKIDVRDPEPFEVASKLPPGVGSAATPPQIQPAERTPATQPPKLAFENVGGASGMRTGGSAAAGRIPVPPKNTIEEAARAAARGRGSGGLAVGDIGEGLGGVAPSLGQPTGAPKNLSSLELMSDPMGVDFKPYLIRILATVKRNWQAVMPESVRLGRRGRVLIQFAIARDGNVPKLVIAAGSGADALDRAAVASISASNPFPPLPDEFQGQQVRLQFTFMYNMPTTR
ncbi:MAG: TonB family protein [Bryobacterales bacterium]|nr:TonB family protein [Bryobacterales bacterium]